MSCSVFFSFYLAFFVYECNMMFRAGLFLISYIVFSLLLLLYPCWQRRTGRKRAVTQKCFWSYIIVILFLSSAPDMVRL
ncbi:hypothetical protein P167DRAFT_60281 [Morchella conica CCBAS932]|uniref:Uncharacterized protein n=1 Tax=Morchella conica CCBAS932 TaxID=1392247 RepID=A0A3N4KVY1_9PEZI|nr:hypothetical protein P167DRAFT_388266 [Morchella conica CCBAS932]RPB14680.1 hypothetical protein P167DRAFT_60281 [Morchella conica CCBAS932]